MKKCITSVSAVGLVSGVVLNRSNSGFELFFYDGILMIPPHTPTNKKNNYSPKSSKTIENISFSSCRTNKS